MNAPTLRRPARQRGVAAILVTVSALALIAMAGLALDLGVAYVAKSRLQNALDAAALSGAKILNDTRSVSLATTAAQTDFAANMGSISVTVAVSTSPTLTPFASGPNPRFLRVSVAALPVALRLVSALPGIGDTLNVAGSAVAGPIPLGGTICSALPVALCGTNNDTDCSDGACYGYTAGAANEIEFKGDNTSLKSGNYGLVELSCGTGASCVRSGMAGGEEYCFTIGGTLVTEPGVKQGPTSQGLDTRFGIYAGPTSAAQYPPDVVTANSPVIFYNTYLSLLSSGVWNYPSPPGRPQRRVVTVPVINCSTPVTGRSTVPLLGGACVFLTRPVSSSGSIYGQLITACEADGSVPTNPDPASPYYKIILYRDPASSQS
ncbi:TadE/TadG family type IV pilus assembly protein [Fontimonas sp. SYSU GA230001]|uniref:TadE/TadG family type IV pilus assembly protein n=1 Tax=Fontimonas sp. SYSU GA230001 TaxID=3142450 RepID=UPI0032B58A57